MDLNNVNEVMVDEFVMIPTLISAFSCGLGTPFNDGYEYDKVPISFVKHDKCFMLQITGDSMEPTLSYGDKCFIDINATPSHDCIVAVVRCGEFMVKRLIHKGFSKFLVSDNKKYAEIKLHEDDTTMVLGVVYGFLRKF